MPTIDFTLNSGDCVSLFYEHRNPGAEQSILFLHGLGTTHESWQKQIHYFEQKGYQVFAPDIPGFGASGITHGRFSASLVADSMEVVFKTHGISEAVIIGHSMGGPLAIHCCLAYPERYTKCILSNTFAHIRLTSVSSAFAYLKRFVLANLQDSEQQAAFIAHKTFPGEDDRQLREMFQQQILQTDKDVYKDAVNLLARVNLLPALHDLKLPCLVITGLEDQTIPPKLQHELMRHLPHAIEVGIQHGKHGMIFSQGDLINTVMEDFLTWQPSV